MRGRREIKKQLDRRATGATKTSIPLLLNKGGGLSNSSLSADEAIDFQRRSQKSPKLLDSYIDEKGATYEGEIRAGKLNGIGKITFLSGEVWEGAFSNNRLMGQGKRTLPEGSVMTGAFLNSELNGHGRIVLRNGDSYRGYFKDSKLCGKGKVKIVKDSKSTPVGKRSLVEYREGTFVDDVLQGEGSIRLVVVYDRYRRNDRYYRRGRLVDNPFIEWEIGQYRCCIALTTGTFVHGKLNGQGFHIGDLVSMEGEFKEGVLHGEGTTTTFEYGGKGSPYEYAQQTNEDGVSVTEARLLKKNSTLKVDFEGYSPKETQTGHFVNGKLEGQGVILTANSRLKGYFSEGNYQGGGKYCCW